MKKILLLCTVLLIAALFVGCTNVSIEYKLDIDNTLEVNYTLTIDKTKEDFKDYNYYNLKNAITRQWDAQGLYVTVDENDEQIVFVGTLEKKHDSRQEAYESLDTIFKNSYSPFVNAGFEYASSYFEDEYNFSANISLIDLIRRSDDNVLPTDMQQMLTKYANESEFTLSITLPGEAIDTNADSEEYNNGATTNTWNLKYGDEKDLRLKTILVNQENVDYHKDLTDSTNQTKMIFIYCAGGAAVVLIVFIILFFTLRRRG